jgi:tetratricopeptide (TPR) repeat protein
MKRLLFNLLLLAGPVISASAALVFDAEGVRLFAEGHYARAAALFCESVTAQEMRSGADPAVLAATYFNLAAAERMQGQLDNAAEHYTRSIALREQIAGTDSPDLAHPLAGLAHIYYSEGRLPEALLLAQRAVRVGSADPENWSQYADVRNSLATLLMASGQNKEAAALSGDIAAELELAGRTESPEYVGAAINLGTVQMRLGAYRQAETDLRRAEAAALHVVGPHHRLTATIWNNLANVRAAQGDSASAEKLMLQAIAAFRETLGSRHPEYARGLANLAGFYEKRKRYTDAERLFRQAMEINLAAFGPDSLQVANDRNHLGVLFAARHRYGIARVELEKAMEIAQQRVGQDHPDFAEIAVNLAIVYHAQGANERAALLLARAVPVKEHSLGPDSPELASILRLQASTDRKLERYAEAAGADMKATRITVHNQISKDTRI